LKNLNDKYRRMKAAPRDRWISTFAKDDRVVT